MPTVISHTVDPDGTGDYTTLQAWETAQQRNLVTADEIAKAVCISSAGGVDAAQCVVAGWTTDATRYIWITGESDPHGGKWNTNTYRLEKSDSWACLTIQQVATVVEFIQLNNTHTNAPVLRSSVTVAGTENYRSLILKTTGASKTATIFNSTTNAPTRYIRNCIAYGASDTGGVGFLVRTSSTKIYNCTVNDCATGYSRQETPTIINCIAMNCGDGFAPDWSASSDYNASDIASDAPGANSQTGSVTFVGAEDFHLAAGDTVAANNGTNAVLTDANNPVTTDIDGQSRPQGTTVDIGADERLAVAGFPYSFGTVIS